MTEPTAIMKSTATAQPGGRAAVHFVAGAAAGGPRADLSLLRAGLFARRGANFPTPAVAGLPGGVSAMTRGSSTVTRGAIFPSRPGPAVRRGSAGVLGGAARVPRGAFSVPGGAHLVPRGAPHAARGGSPQAPGATPCPGRLRSRGRGRSPWRSRFAPRRAGRLPQGFPARPVASGARPQPQVACPVPQGKHPAGRQERPLARNRPLLRPLAGGAGVPGPSGPLYPLSLALFTHEDHSLRRRLPLRRPEQSLGESKLSDRALAMKAMCRLLLSLLNPQPRKDT